jgi:hypothetical protein
MGKGKDFSGLGSNLDRVAGNGVRVFSEKDWCSRLIYSIETRNWQPEPRT